MKLWKATVEIEVFIAGDKQPGSYQVLDDAEKELHDNADYGADWSVVEVKDIEEVPTEWRDSLPRGDRANKLTCEELLLGTLAEREAAEAARLEAIRNAPMPNQLPLALDGP